MKKQSRSIKIDNLPDVNELHSPAPNGAYFNWETLTLVTPPSPIKGPAQTTHTVSLSDAVVVSGEVTSSSE